MNPFNNVRLIEVDPYLAKPQPCYSVRMNPVTGTYEQCMTVPPKHRKAKFVINHKEPFLITPGCSCCHPIQDRILILNSLQSLNAFLKFTLLQNKSRKFNEWLFDPDHYAGKWHKKNMLRDFQ